VSGNLDYFQRCVDRSAVLEYDAEERIYTLKAGDTFIFGGDVCDKGPGDIRIVKILTDLKKRYPEQVFLIVGNRDVNKLRMASELTMNAIADPTIVEDEDYPCWVAQDKRVTYKKYLEGLGGLSENNLVNRCETLYYGRTH
jgi:predicted phosphodiesterase